MNDVKEHRIQVTVNGVVYERYVASRTLLADFLREDLGLRGTHLGCEHGICGACTVLLNGQAVRSCLLFAVQVHGARIETVEGLAQNGRLHPLQQGFWEKHALQCGYCTPGVLMAATELLRDCPQPTEAQIKETLAGNLCRCTGYVQIVEAVRRASRALRHDESGGGEGT